ncbi:DNRLRE domain-containing protein [Sphaerisporangium sp. NPDC051017]|uniref:DNRLRE domain-containing protein n=1 Tax=Sphaerisporangium sp. NPDC051017 TaxID=3154636 RepID=UPI003446C1A1
MTLGVGLSPLPARAEPAPLRLASAPEPTPQPGGELVVDKFIASAQTKAAKAGQRVEVPGHQTESSTVYANPDGKTLRMELYTEPIRVKKPDGEGFTPIDTTLVQRDGVIEPKAVLGKLALSAGGDRTLLRSDSERSAASVSAPSKLPKPLLKGNTATYRSAYGQGVDLQVTATVTGFRQKIVIGSRPTGPLRFRLPVDLPEGMSFTADAAGRPSLMSGGEKVLDLRPGILLDAVAEAPDAPIDGGRPGKAPVTLEPGTSTLVYAPDPAFLAGPAVTYPVTLMAVDSDWWEPDIADGGSDTFINNDAWMYSADGFNLDRILVRKSNSGSVRWRSYLKFPDIPHDSPLRQGTVQNADLTLWNHQSNSCGDVVGSGVIARRVTSPWDELSLHWNAQPTVTNAGSNVEFGAYSPDCALGGWAAKEWYLIHSVNGIVQEWADGAPNYGIQLAAGNENDLTNWRRYRTQEYTCCSPGAHPPKLTVDFEPGQRLRLVFGLDERPSDLPTYDEAAANAIEPGEEDLPPMTVAASIEHNDAPGVAYEVRPNNLKPLAGGEWSVMDPDVGDDEPPTVVAVSPVADATAVPVDQQVTVTFSEPVDETAFTLKTAAGVPVTGTTVMDEAKLQLTFTPGAPLAEGTVYMAEVADAMDLWENDLATHTWSFTTVDSGERGRWNFDEGEGETAADSSGRGKDATLTGTANWTTGKNGNAVSNTKAEAFAAARAEAVRQGQPVEVAGATTATSVTHAEPDGKRFTTTITSGPTRSRVDGRWVPIDTSLVERDGALRPQAIDARVDVQVSTGGTGAFVAMATEERRYALTWPTVLPRPTVKGNVATYANAAGKGADLVVTVLPTGFRHDVVLRERPAKPLELRIGVETGRLTLLEGKDGGLLLKAAKDGKPVASAPEPVMWDTPSGRQGTPGGFRKRGKISTDVVTNGGRQVLVLRPDARYLADAATKYPVTIDPTTTLPLTTDTTVFQGETRSYAGETYMAAGASGDPLFGIPFQLSRAHMKFDTSALSGVTVSTASLQAYRHAVNTLFPCSSSSGIIAARVTAAWNPATLTWANKPATTTTGQVTTSETGNCAAGQYMSWPVTAIAQAWASGTANHGVELRGVSESANANYQVYFNTSEYGGGHPPTLNVTYTIPSAPTVSGLAITPATQQSGTTIATSLTPQLAATVSDTAGSGLTGQFEVEHDPAATGQGTGQIWTGSLGNVPADTQANITVPADTLTDGWTVRWRARAVSATAASAWSDWQSFIVSVPKPTATGLTIIPSKVVDGVTVATTLTPTLKATLTHPTGQAIRAEAEIEHDPAAPEGQGTGQIWTGSVVDVASGTQAGITVPAGELTDGWKVRWRFRAVTEQAASAWSDWQQVTIDVTQPGEEPLAQTAGPVIRTDQSFTAAAWLRWNDKEGDYQIIEQRGTNRAPFRLGNMPEHGLVFTLADSDTAGAAMDGVLSGVEPPVDQWFHLAGVYDADADTVTLYLDGEAIDSAPIGFDPWHAESAMTLGTRMLGDLDEARVYQRALSAEAVAGLLAEPAVQKAPAVEKAETKAGTTAEAAAAVLPGFDYERHDLDTCNDKLIPSGLVYTAEGFRELKPYSGCWTKWLGWGEWDVDRKKSVAAGKPIPVPDPDDAVVAETTVVMHTYLGNADGTGVVGGGSHNPRDISVWTKVKDVRAFDDGQPTTKFDNDYMRLEVTADEGEDSGDCVRRASDTDRRAKVGTWRAGTAYDDYVFTSLPKAGDDASIDICEISPKLYYEDRWGPLDGEIALWNKPERRVYRYSQVPRVRCDNSKMGNKVGSDEYRHKKACVFGSANRIFTMSLSDTNITGAALHNFMAMNFPNATRPELLDSDGNLLNKDIPGDYGPGSEPKDKENFLRRGTASPSADAKAWVRENRTKISTPCRHERTRLEGQEVVVKKTLECDEFPYASSKQGAKDANGHYSIMYIPKLQNNIHGRYLSAFYSRYRVGTDNKFWVRIVD